MAGGVDNLKPIAPGEVRNPTGRNQYSYRNDAEKLLDELAKEVRNDKARLSQVLDRLFVDAERGQSYAMRLLIERVLPVTQISEHRFPDGIPSRELPIENPSEYRQRLQQILEGAEDATLN